MWRALLGACLLATLAAACADEDLIPTPTPEARARATAGPKTATTPPAPPLAKTKGPPTPRTAGPAIPSRQLAPIEFPADLAVVTQNLDCWGCEPGLDPIIRAYRDPSGRLRVETLLEMRQPLDSLPAFIWRTHAQGRKGLAVTECLGADCRMLLRTGNYTRPLQSVQFAIRRSVDGGVTWSSTPTEPGKGALLAGFAGDELLLAQPWVEGMPTMPRGAYFLFPSGREVLPPPDLAARSLTRLASRQCPPVRLQTTRRSPTCSGTTPSAAQSPRKTASPGTAACALRPRVVRLRAANPFPLTWHSRYSSWLSYGDVLLVWAEGPRYEGRWGVTSRTPGYSLVRYAYDGLADAGAWVLDELAFPPVARFVVAPSTANSAREPDGRRDWPARLVMLDTATGDVQPYIAPELEDANLGWVLLAYQGPFARAIRTDACTEVRAAPSTAAPALECAANGVLFQRTAPPTVDGAWLGVTSPAGVSAAETRYLEW